MSSRKIKDAKDLSTNELIYFKGHAKATYMSDGTTVEDAINNIATDGDTGGSVDLSNYATKEEVNAKQDKLISGSSIKTINNTSLLGTGNITVGNYPLSTTTSSSMSLSPNTYYRNTNTSLSSLTITLVSSSTLVFNEYFVEFTTRSSNTTISLPTSIKWANGETPTFEASTTYQISIVNNLGIVTKFK